MEFSFFAEKDDEDNLEIFYKDSEGIEYRLFIECDTTYLYKDNDSEEYIKDFIYSTKENYSQLDIMELESVTEDICIELKSCFLTKSYEVWKNFKINNMPIADLLDVLKLRNTLNI